MTYGAEQYAENKYISFAKRNSVISDVAFLV